MRGVRHLRWVPRRLLEQTEGAGPPPEQRLRGEAVPRRLPPVVAVVRPDADADAGLPDGAREAGADGGHGGTDAAGADDDRDRHQQEPGDGDQERAPRRAARGARRVVAGHHPMEERRERSPEDDRHHGGDDQLPACRLHALLRRGEGRPRGGPEAEHDGGQDCHEPGQAQARRRRQDQQQDHDPDHRQAKAGARGGQHQRQRVDGGDCPAEGAQAEIAVGGQREAAEHADEGEHGQGVRQRQRARQARAQLHAGGLAEGARDQGPRAGDGGQRRQARREDRAGASQRRAEQQAESERAEVAGGEDGRRHGLGGRQRPETGEGGHDGEEREATCRDEARRVRQDERPAATGHQAEGHAGGQRGTGGDQLGGTRCDAPGAEEHAPDRDQHGRHGQQHGSSRAQSGQRAHRPDGTCRSVEDG